MKVKNKEKRKYTIKSVLYKKQVCKSQDLTEDEKCVMIGNYKNRLNWFVSKKGAALV